MQFRAHWQFYREMIPFILPFCVVEIILFGVLWGFVLFVLFGPLVGALGFHVLKKDQYYFYYNLGMTRKRLLKVAYLINLLLGVPIFALLSVLFYLFIGQPAVT
ncbi:MAG: hypothetical protein CMC08_02405 [Flavobacteriaceae bacterium]|nr:hypothetical protein [Flavobacteriaceae bacterium]